MEAASSDPVFTLRAREPTPSEQPGSHYQGRRFLKRSVPRAVDGPGTGAESRPSYMMAWRLDTATQGDFVGGKDFTQLGSRKAGAGSSDRIQPASKSPFSNQK